MHNKSATVFKLYTIMVIIGLVSCSNTPPTSTPLLSVTVPSIPLPKSTPVSTSTEFPNDVVKNQCFEILPALPPEITLPGILVLSKPDGLSLLKFNQQTRREIPGLIHGVGTSPDRKWLSYVFIAEDVEEKLVIESADGKIQAEVPTQQGWLIFDKALWLDKERLWFPVFPDLKRGQVAPTVVLNPFTGDQQELTSDYPDIEQYQIGFASSPRLHFGYSSVVYHPLLNLVIYPQLAEDGWYIVLWDRQFEKILVKIPDGGLYGHMPLWLPNGNHFVVVARRDWNSPREWLIVSQDGEIQQLTHFEDLYPQFEIGNYASVSRDGHYLAFGLSQNTHNNDATSDDPKQLTILDLDTLEVFNTCITSSYPEPVWSPDSEYIAVLTRGPSKRPSSIVILNIKQVWAAKIEEDPKVIPVDWLKSP